MDAHLLERITIEAGKCGGRPCVRGMRIRVSDILEMLGEGVSVDHYLRFFIYHRFPFYYYSDIMITTDRTP